MEITPYKQSLTHSCLVACFLMLLQAQKGITFTQQQEQALALKGSQRKYSYYVEGIPAAVANSYKENIKVIADNKHFANFLALCFRDYKNIAVEHHPVTIDLIRTLVNKQPIICHIDDNLIGDYSHASHFIVIEKASGGFFFIIDPWVGERKRISQETLEKAIHSLKTHIKMCPLLFSIQL